MATAKRVSTVLMAALLVACFTGCPAQLAARAAAGQSDPGAATEQQAGGDQAAVRTFAPQKISLARTTTQPATIHAYHQAEVYAKVAGYLEELNVDIGQKVEAGTVLATIAVPEMAKAREKQQAAVRHLQADEKRAGAEITVAQANAESAQAALEQARADVSAADAHLKAARIEFERVDELVQSQALAERLRDEALKRFESAQAAKSAVESAVVSAGANLGVAKAKLEAARADLATARARTEVAAKELEELDARMSYLTLRSPFPGIVTERNADPGDLIGDSQNGLSKDGTPLFVVTRLDRIRVRVPVPERDAPLVDVGDAVQITLPALPDQTLEGEVSRVAGLLAEQTRTMLAEIDLPNPHRKILPGMFGQATITLEAPREKLTLPARAVRYDEHGNSYVYVVNAASEIEVVEVSTGLDDGQQIEITSGLNGDERVVEPLLRRLKPGQKVRASAAS
jgi:RND family efflux transporter MFP subunit